MPGRARPRLATKALSNAQRVLLLGLGGGGDVVGALALTDLIERLGADWVLGGVAWERSPIDPRPGPRSLDQITGGRSCGPAAVLASAETATDDGVRFSESRMAEHTGREILLFDITGGPEATARGLGAAAAELRCDLVVIVDVGGDVLAHGHEPGLASPLCDAVMLAAGAILAGPASRATPEPSPEAKLRRGRPDVMAAVYGPGCDGELTAAEVLERIGQLGAAEALHGTWPLTPAACDLVEEAARVVPTEASLQAARCARGERGTTTIRGGRREVELTALGALTFFFDPVAAVESTAPLARAVHPATGIEEAREALASLGVRTELDLERARARGERATGAPE